MREKFHSGRRDIGFTLVEILVASAILSVLIVLMVTMLNRTSQMWQYHQSKAEQFRGARVAFDAINRSLSQATLNTYLDYVDSNDNPRTPANSATFVPVRYVRQSELRFISGPNIAGTWNAASPSTWNPAPAPAAAPQPSGSARPSHAIFFQAPLGFTGESNYAGLGNLLNTWGYYIEYAEDPTPRPSFVVSPLRKRFRLMETMQPSESLSLYRYTSGPDGNPNNSYTNWFTDPLAVTGAKSVTHVLAENIIALVLLPKLSPDDDPAGSTLSPTYSYNSIKTDDKNSPAVDPKFNWKNQLPPVIQATLVAIDENSAIRLGDEGSIQLSNKIGSLFADSTKFARELNLAGGTDSLESYLVRNRIQYRIFTTNISIKAAKWSREQSR